MNRIENVKTTVILSIIVALLAAVAGVSGIASDQGGETFEHESIRGRTVTIFGKGIYRHMSEEVAVQGIAQDYVTVFIAVPLLLLSLFFTVKGSLKWRFVFAGSAGYFLVTYLFYLTMGMYNGLFLVYAALLGCSFFLFTLTLLSFNVRSLPAVFSEKTPVRITGGFLVFNTGCIGLLWLSIVVPPLMQGTVYPAQLEHYTTLIVQGLDLGLLLPLSAVSGLLLMGKRPFGYLLAPVYYVFLSLLMIALTAKIIGMGLIGYSIIPVIFIMPAIAFIAFLGAVILIRSLKVV
ncbi:MAG: hypothetical protein ACOC41_05145 [Chitinivibrionales bacterium]